MSLSNALTAEERDLWLVRLYFLILIGGGGFLLPFVSLFFDRQGLSGTQIGLLGTVGAVGQLISAPLWGRWSDTTSRPRRVLQISITGSALAMLALSQQEAFIWMAVIIGIDAVVGGGIMPLSDALALGVSDRNNYGSIRLWGSLGWAVLVLFAGWLIEQTGLFSAFLGYAVSYLLSALFLLLLEPGAARRGQQQREPAAGNALAALREGLLANPYILGLGASIVTVTLFRSGLFRFEPIYLDQLGASESIIGLVSTVGALVELPGMLWADRLVNSMGPRRLLLVTNVIRMGMMLIVLLFPSVAAILITRAIGGIAFSFSSVALVTFVGVVAPGGQRSTALALLTITLPALTNIVGNPLSGLIFDALGAYWLYAFALLGFALAWLILRYGTPRMR